MDSLLSNLSPTSPPLQDSPVHENEMTPSVQAEEDRLTSILERMPAEILVHTASFLPGSSIACLSLTSKRFHQSLHGQFDPKWQAAWWQDCGAEKRRFLRLLEEDLPEMMVCYSCNILYRWEKQRRYLCPKFDRHPRSIGGPMYWGPRGPHDEGFICRNTVHAFLRGFARGSEYGPQLDELNHHCKSAGDGHIESSLDARVVRRKLLLHEVHRQCVILPNQPIGLLRSKVDIGRDIPDGLVPAINRFKDVGCFHSGYSLPAIIGDAYHLREGHPGDRSKCLDLLNCAHCATDIRVRVEERCGGTEVLIEVEVWKSFGGRDFDTRDEMEDAHFDHRDKRFDTFDLRRDTDRNLEDLFREGGEGEHGVSLSSDQPRRRQNWLQSWWCYFDSDEARLCGFSPYNDDKAAPQ